MKKRLLVPRENSIKYRFEMGFIKDVKSKCWLWIKGKNKKGYGQFGIGSGKTYAAHRIAYKLYIGEIPDKMLVCHKCDNPSCVNPDHLWLGTCKDNANDRDRKGRSNINKGEKHPMAKIKEEMARLIKKRILSGEPMAKISRELNLAYTTISNIKSGLSWSFIDV